MTDKVGNITAAAVAKATGRDWDGWRGWLDGEGAAGLDHKGIVGRLRAQGLSHWWAQSVTVGYEQLIGRREHGQTQGASFQLGVSRTFPIADDAAWAALTSPPGRTLWLGEIDDWRGEPGDAYTAADGTRVEVRTVAADGARHRRLRLRWQPPGRPAPITLQLTLVPSGERTSVRLHLEQLADGDEREAMRAHWREVLDELAPLLR